MKGELSRKKEGKDGAAYPVVPVEKVDAGGAITEFFPVPGSIPAARMIRSEKRRRQG